MNITIFLTLSLMFSYARMMDPLIIAYGKGQLSGFLMDPKGVLDVVSIF